MGPQKLGIRESSQYFELLDALSKAAVHLYNMLRWTKSSINYYLSRSPVMVRVLLLSVVSCGLSAYRSSLYSTFLPYIPPIR